MFFVIDFFANQNPNNMILIYYKVTFLCWMYFLAYRPNFTQTLLVWIVLREAQLYFGKIVNRKNRNKASVLRYCMAFRKSDRRTTELFLDFLHIPILRFSWPDSIVKHVGWKLIKWNMGWSSVVSKVCLWTHAFLVVRAKKTIRLIFRQATYYHC